MLVMSDTVFVIDYVHNGNQNCLEKRIERVINAKTKHIKKKNELYICLRNLE